MILSTALLLRHLLVATIMMIIMYAVIKCTKIEKNKIE